MSAKNTGVAVMDQETAMIEPLPYIEHCRPRVLIYTDEFYFHAPSNGFSLELFVKAIATAGSSLAPPRITLAHRERLPYSTFRATPMGPRFPVLSDFRFNLAATPVTRDNYDQVWLFGFATQPSVIKADDINPELGLNDAENMVLIDFMNSGGGLFATGDHSGIGYGVGGRLPRVRHMRNWESTRMGSEAMLGRWERDPATQQLVRLTGADDRRDTISNPGLDGNYTFNDQSDETAQRIFPRYTVKMINYGTATTPAYQTGKWVAKPHVLLRNRFGMGVRDTTAQGFASGNTDWSYAYAYSRDISFLPDHAHEGECFELSNDGPDEIWRKSIPTRSYTSFGFNFEEFGPGWNPIPADMVALSVAGGRAIAVGLTDANGFWKPPVTPRIFGAVSAFDGHVCPKYLTVSGLQNLRRPGRVVCDSTWHHFVNVNLNGEGSNRDPGLYLRNPATGALTPSTALNHIYQYYKNTLLWLQPYEYSACLLTLGFADFRKNAVLMHELSGHAAFATVDDIRIGGRLLIEFFDTQGGAICADELAKSLLVSAERWNEFSAMLDIRHNDAAPVDSCAILEFAFGRALAAHFKRYPGSREIDTLIGAESRAAHTKSEAALIKAFADGCKEGVAAAVADAVSRATALKALAKGAAHGTTRKAE